MQQMHADCCRRQRLTHLRHGLSSSRGDLPHRVKQQLQPGQYLAEQKTARSRWQLVRGVFTSQHACAAHVRTSPERL